MPSLEFREKQLPLWEEMIINLFEGSTPLQKVWSDREEIIEVLDYVGTHKALNHTFLPDGGGWDLFGCSLSVEPECIDLKMNAAFRIKPKKLTFQWFEEAGFDWAYFMLEADELEVSGVYEKLSSKKEELVEIINGNNIPSVHWAYQEYDEEKLSSDNARFVVRYTSGQFVIFSKGSKYYLDSSTYDGRHDKATPKGFEKYIGEIVKRGRDYSSPIY